MSYNPRMKTLTAILAFLALSACGGGESSAPAAPSTPPAQVTQVPAVFIGDAITAGWAVEAIIPGAVNKGVPGETSSAMLARFSKDVLALRPARVHILGGTADLLGQPATEVEAVIEMARQAVVAGVPTYVGTLIPRGDFTPFGDVNAVEDYNQALRMAAPVYGFHVVEYYQAMATPVYFDVTLYRDATRPNAQGYLRMEGVLKAALGL